MRNVSVWPDGQRGEGRVAQGEWEREQRPDGEAQVHVAQP